MKITIAGSGAMGCRFGAALFEAGHQVTLLDGWREHVTAINEAGLRVTDATGTRTLAVPAVPLASLTRPARVPGPPGAPAVVAPADLVIVFAKATATAAVAAAAAPARSGRPPWSSRCRTASATSRRCSPTCLRTGCSRAPRRSAPSCSGRGISGRSGRARPCSARCRRELAGARRVATERPPSGFALARYARRPGSRSAPSPNALEVIWAKVAFNCVMNSLCSIASIPVSALARYDGFDALAGSILDEVAAVARAEGVTVDTAAALRLMHAQFDPSASGDHLASMLQDLMNGRPTEIAHLNGAIAARAAARGIDAPVNATVSRLIGLLEATWTGRVNRLHPETP